MAKITHTLVTKKDWSTVYNIELEMAKSPIYYTFTDREEFERRIAPCVVYLLYYDNKVAGYCSYEMKEKDLAEINGMAVLEKYRRKGVGTYALNVLLDALKDIKTILLVTHPENTISIPMYMKKGFVIKGWKDNYINNQPRLILFKYNNI